MLTWRRKQQKNVKEKRVSAQTVYTKFCFKASEVKQQIESGHCKMKHKKEVKTEKKLQIKENNQNEFSWWTVFCVAVILTAATRYYKVTEPDMVCWDETHFGKMGSWYINRTFFFDVHPPLGKMLIALSGYMTGYNGTFSFEKPGEKYNGTRYEGMRLFCTTLGALIVPMSFDTVYELTHSLKASVVAAVYLIFDVGMITLNQYILLDPILLCFMTASLWGMVKVSKFTQNGKSYTSGWWGWLFFTGSMICCTISVKFVGLFIVLLVGLHTINELWMILGDLSQPVLETIKQLICRAITLIIWPIVLYVFFFYIHLSVLNRSGNGDGFYSSAFQSRLIGNSLYNVSLPRHVAYGSIVSIKNYKTGGGYLHSHPHLYPKGNGARQQQITTYTHKDDNNKWLVKPHNKESHEELTLVRHGDLVRLEHVMTRRNLHSHQERAPMTKKHLQVTGYGENGMGDANDIWRITVVGGVENDTIQTVTSKLKIIHYLQNCALTSSGNQLPKWGFEQQEVSCNPNLRDKLAHWNVEHNQHDKLPSVNFSIYAPGFLDMFIESHAVMFHGNAGLKPKEGEQTSRPWQWPIIYKGQFFSGTDYRIYLLGNPLIWWSNLVFLMLFLIVFIFSAIRERRRAGKKQNEKIKNASGEKSLQAAGWLFLGWVLHYLPFWAMGRVLYFHHYFPALIFNSLLSGVMFDYLTNRLPRWLHHIIMGVLLATVVYSFVLFAPLSYGMRGPLANDPNSTMHSLKWLNSWEF